MPHLTLEYTDNLEFDIQPLLARLHEEIVATGAVNLKGLKSRAVRHTDYRIADGNPDYAFVHINLLIREGRPLEIQQDVARPLLRRWDRRAACGDLRGGVGGRRDEAFLCDLLDLPAARLRSGVARRLSAESAGSVL